ncbi:creatininase family protein [soil metagenome]
MADPTDQPDHRDRNDVLTLAGADAARFATDRFVVLPLGSIEYHGPHAPLGTDTTLALGFARELAERSPCLVLPPITYAFTPQITSARPGTLSVTPDVFLAYLTEVLRATVRAGATRVLALNGHSENQFAARLAAEAIVLEHPEASVAVVNWWRLVDPDAPLPFTEAGGNGHGGPLEISTTAAFDARGVGVAAASDIASEAPWWRGVAQVVGRGGRPIGFEGYHGRIGEVSVAAGREVIDAVVPNLLRFVDGWLERAASDDG